MILLLKYISVFILSTTEIWAAAPLGVAYKMPPVIVVVICTVGAAIGMAFLLFIGGAVRDFFVKKYSKKKNRENSRMVKIWKKYGVTGLGIIGPVLVGSPVIAVLGILLNVKRKKLLLFSLIGIFLKAVILTTASVFGFSFLF